MRIVTEWAEADTCMTYALYSPRRDEIAQVVCTCPVSGKVTGRLNLVPITDLKLCTLPLLLSYNFSTPTSGGNMQ